MKKGMAGLSMTQSFNNTVSSNLGTVNQVMPLKYILKRCPLTRFEINADTKSAEGAASALSADGAQKKKKKHTVELKKTSASNAAKI